MSFWNRFGFGTAKPEIVGITADDRGNVVPRFQDTRWAGASRVIRSIQNWWAQTGSATSDLNRGEQKTLRARARDAMRNHPLARAALTRARTNIVGTGLMCRPAIDYVTLGLTADDAERINAEIRTAWERWAEDPLECDAEATLDFYGLQSLALLSALMSGDCFALTPWEERVGGVSGLKVQLFEADRVENPNSESDRVGLIDGVKLSPLGQPLGYWFRSNHPGDSIVSSVPAKWVYVAAFGAETGRRRVMHLWNDKERPGQVRGAPFLAPILEPLRQISKWSENEMMAAVVSSLFTVFLKNTAPESLDPDGNVVTPFGGAPTTGVTLPATNPDGTSPDPATFAPPAQATGVSLGNGAIVDLAPGEKANPVNPTRPNANFDPFFTAVAKQMGAALELPVDELMLHYQSSYSAARAAMLQAWRFYTMRRWFLTQQFCAPVYGLFLDEEVATGRLTLPGYADPIRRRAWTRALWIGPARGSMDERQEALAAQVRIDAGISNETIEQRKADGTWAKRPAETVRVSPVTDPNETAKAPSDPAEADNPAENQQ
jgi:lambda family phage portal protein